MEALDLRGLVPAPVTPFNRDGEVDHAAIQRLGSWLGSFDGVKGLVVLGHAGEGTFLTADEQTAVIESFVKSVNGQVPVIAGITLEGTKVAADEAKRAVKAGAEAGLVYPSHGWLRFGSAWLRAGSSIGPILVGSIVAGAGIQYVFAAFAAVAVVGGLVTVLFAIETTGRILEELSP